ncbi:urease accessory protein UreF [Hwanghaeella grinnelliae]|uniref:Urease accessory protein UreF n=1 Tax=Hwanghaeella grinnelliae TaxID=2500179 RepID=A0A3S2ZBQ8_9PROT|nr:urease accessory protein UreF [Hwanghaeella grinnelliae]RVU38919.1 urease accessory protein UreF [Hwanghaeella grinnelliae]
MAAPSSLSESRALLRLMTWMSPSFPVGAFTYSHGLEWAVEQGDVKDAETLRLWLLDVLQHGSGRSDAILLAEAWRRVTGQAGEIGEGVDLADLVDLALALNPSEERLLESESQGKAFVKAAKAGWPVLDGCGEDLVRDIARAPYPIAVGAVAGLSGIALEDALAAFLHGVVANLVSAGVRLVPLGQSDGIRVLAALEGELLSRADWAAKAGFEELGGFAPLIDIASMKHETQYTRLFRS